ncbi:MAG: hypothetical protein MRY32_07720 [Rickettsiales bacterium]|nr:hypothetical protein [Rickettsiales bacterium]
MRLHATFAPLLLSLILITPNSALAGAWLQGNGDILVIDTNTYYASDAFFNDKSNKQSQPGFFKVENNLYLEYGLNKDWTLGANLFAHYLAQETSTTYTFLSGASVTIDGWDSNVGFGDPELFARTKLYKDDFTIISLQPLIKLPSWYESDTLPKGGSDDWDTELSVLAGHSFEAYGRYHFAEARIGYRHRFHNQLEDQIKLDAKLGWNIYPDLQWINAIYGTFSVDMPDNPVFTQSGQNDYHLAKIESNLLYNLQKDWFVQLGLFAHVWGRNTGHGYGVSVSTGRTLP